jgi:DNA modification methylase
MTYQILQGDALAQLRTLPDESVQCCITSPPYYGLRQYLFEGAVTLRRDLTDEQKAYVLAELSRRGVQPRKS